MSCYRLFVMYRLDNGSLVTYGPDAAGGQPVRLPCGRCPGCLMERSQHWAMRCRHEASCWTHNVFLTLTYDNEHLPWHGSLDKSHLQKFLKRFRKAFSGVEAAPGSDHCPIRFFGCGEYGERSKRAHYHVLLFNVRIDDARVYGEKTFTSERVSALWPFGSHLIGSVTPASAAYVAGYATKKVVGRVERERAYEVVDPRTGECVQRVPEFSLMSRRPGIGQYWYDKFKTDLRRGSIVVDGAEVPVPRFYEDKYRADFPEQDDEREYARYVARVSKDPDELSEERLQVKELVALARRRLFRRETLLEG